MALQEQTFNINGVFSTDKTVIQNLETLCTAAGSWFTFDIHTGKWSVIINQPGYSTASFDDDNILGSISISGTGLTELYNSVKVEFPHSDLNDERDFVQISIPLENRFINEYENTLEMQFDCINDPLQAEVLGFVELKQSRVDKIIQFRTDYSQLGLKAGDLIDVTSAMYGFDQKMFRIVTVSEEDEGNSIVLSITALEYDADVYNFDNIDLYEVSNANGIITIGAIGIPGTPQVTSIQVDARPRVIIESAAPSGIVEAMEFWIYNMPQSEIPNWQLIDDSTRTYTLAATIRPVSGSGEVFAVNDDVVFESDSISGAFLVKTRGINSTTIGDFSDVSGNVYYDPTQVTDAIGPNTDVLDDNWNSILGLLGANGLLALLKALMEDNATGPGSIFDMLRQLGLSSTDDMFNDLLDNRGFTPLQDTYTTGMLTVVPSETNASVDRELSLGRTFQAQYTGIYRIKYNLNWGGNGTPILTRNDDPYYRSGIQKNSEILIKSGGSRVPSLFYSDTTGDVDVQLYEDHFIEGVYYLQAGQTISYHALCATDWGYPIRYQTPENAAVVVISYDTILITRV